MNEFKEVSENYTLAEAVREAQRCLHCKVPSCISLKISLAIVKT